MSFNDTLSRFILISGLDEAEAAKWTPVITDACDYVMSLVSKESLTDYEKKRLDKAAAVNAYYRYILYTSPEDSSFKVGDISLTKNHERIENARKMWEEEYNGISDIIKTSHFSFKAVS